MKVIDVHPEELLDRELRGGLGHEQRLLLDAHLSQCESCRLERLLRADFRAEAVRTSEADMQSFVLGALQRAASAEANGAATLLGAAERSAVSSGSRGRLSASLAVACVLLVAAGAAASQSAWVERIFRITFGEISIEAPGHGQHKRAAKARGAEARGAERPSPATGVAVSTAAESNPRAGPNGSAEVVFEPLRAPDTNARLASSEPQRSHLRTLVAKAAARTNSYRPAARTARITNTRGAKPARASAASVKQPEVSNEPVPGSAVPEPALDPARAATQAAAAALFEQANRARRSGRLDQAATLYESLQRTYAGSPEAKLSFALSARMWLDAGNAFAAHGGFERYLATGDRALREEAMTGRALSLERLGRKSAADAAFAELLQAYPYSSYAPLAKKRLGQD